MSFSVIIPARYAATRLPGKLLLDLAGRPLLAHTVECALASEARQVAVATDDERIAAVAEAAGAKPVMTSASHASGTDRIHEAGRALGLRAEEIVVNVQGDEPLIPVEAINEVAANLERHAEAGIASLCEAIADPAEFADANAVKVVRDLHEFALYFSRAPIPFTFTGARPGRESNRFFRSNTPIPQGGAFRHIGIYAYRMELLDRYVHWPRADLEVTERLEQLRALARGVKIHVATTQETFPPGIDTMHDLDRAQQFLLAKEGNAS